MNAGEMIYFRENRLNYTKRSGSFAEPGLLRSMGIYFSTFFFDSSDLGPDRVF